MRDNFTSSSGDVKQRKFSLGPHRSGYGPEKIEKMAPHPTLHHDGSFEVCSCFPLGQVVCFVCLFLFVGLLVFGVC